MRDEGNQVSREDFAVGCALYALDLTADLADHFNLLNVGVRLDTKFPKALPNTINVVAFTEFENIFEIDYPVIKKCNFSLQ